MIGRLRPFGIVRARAAVYDRENVDTDRILPARFLRKPREEPDGYAPYLFHDVEDLPPALRSQGAGTVSEILIAGRNFGCGSSREGAVYALADAGVRAVVAESFGDIFRANAARNGLLPAVVDAQAAAVLRAAAAGGETMLEIDLESQRIALPDGRRVRFAIDGFAKSLLLAGQDELGFTLSRRPEIDAFAERAAAARPWLVPHRRGFDLQTES